MWQLSGAVYMCCKTFILIPYIKCPYYTECLKSYWSDKPRIFKGQNRLIILLVQFVDRFLKGVNFVWIKEQGRSNPSDWIIYNTCNAKKKKRKDKKDKLWFRFIQWVFIDASTKNRPAGKQVDFSTWHSFFLGMTVSWGGTKRGEIKWTGQKKNCKNNFPQYN